MDQYSRGVNAVDLTLTLDDEAEGDALDAPRALRDFASHLALRTKLLSGNPISRSSTRRVSWASTSSRLISPGLLESLLNRRLRDLVEDDATASFRAGMSAASTMCHEMASPSRSASVERIDVLRSRQQRT